MTWRVLGALVLASLFGIAQAANTPCSGRKGGVSHCSGQLFICNDGSASQSKKVCNADDYAPQPKKRKIGSATANPFQKASVRSYSAKSAFKNGNACPVGGTRSAGCSGYVIDHIRPLCAGGPDIPANMQWQTVADSKIKDRDEYRECRALRLVRVGEVVHQE